MQKLVSSILLLVGIAMTLGGFGHSLGGVGQVKAALIAHAVPEEISKLVLVVWHFAGGCMTVLGVLIIRFWFQLRRSVIASAFAPLLIAIFYLAFGGGALAYSNRPFFLVFVLLGAVLFACTLFLRPNQTMQPTADRSDA
jgi:hypothetical protein